MRAGCDGGITWYGKWGYLWSNWLVSIDHKKIGVMYITLALLMLMRGFVDAIMMRTQQTVALNSHGYLPPGHFDQIFSSHGTIMIFFLAMPFLTGLINIVVPQQIGTRDVSFPFMNSISLWLTAAAAALVMVSLVIGKFSTAGWSAYPPYSELKFTPGVGVQYWIWTVLISGVGSTLTGINFFVTILKRRAPGMTLMRMPLFTWTALCTSVLMIFAFPALTVVSTLLGLDRYLGMHFFTNGAGGDMMNYANLFWIWGHPEVYILILPAFGVYSEVVATFSGKPLFGYRSLVYATAAITLLSFMVWLHHFFTMGASANVNAFFGMATMIIAVPTGVKIFDWLFTMYRGRVRMASPMYWAIGFIVTFAIGGITGVLLAIAPVDYLMHNTTFLVAHFHNMLIPGALFGYLAGYQYWFPKALGFRLDEKWGKRAFWAWIVGFYLAFMPLYVLGFMGNAAAPGALRRGRLAALVDCCRTRACFPDFPGDRFLPDRPIGRQFPKSSGIARHHRRSRKRAHPGMGQLAARALQFRDYSARPRHRRPGRDESRRNCRHRADQLSRHRYAER